MSTFTCAITTHPSKVAGSLKVNEVILARIQWSVPVAIVGVVVPDGEGSCLRQAAGRKLSCVVVRRRSSRSARGLTLGQRSGEAVLMTHLSPLHLPRAILLHHHHMVGATETTI